MPVRRLTAALLLAAALLPRMPAEEEPQPFPDMAPQVGNWVGRTYYDPSRFRPRLLVQRALRALENAETGIRAQWTGGSVLVSAPGLAEPQRIDAPEPEDIGQAMAIIEGVRLAVDGCELPARRRRELAYVLLNGALLSLDPHTTIDPPEPAREMVEGLAGEFYGIGAYLTQDEGVIAIERVMPGLPAERAGIENGDIVLAVDGEKTAGLSLEQAVRRIKGPKGSTVQLSLERKGLAAPIAIPVVRDLVQIVRTRAWRQGGVAYLRMDEFNARLATDVMAAIEELGRGGPFKALVLDLRYNPGGILDQAEAVSDIFLPKGREIVRTVGAVGKPSIVLSSSRQLVDVPLVVLVSGGSASASEILSGCLQRNGRAVVAGVQTFGKGTVQTLRPLRDGSRLRLTIQEYQLPGGVSIQGIGVTPDLLLLRRSAGRHGRIDLLPFSGMKEGDDEFAIRASNAYRHDPALVLGWLAPHLDKEAERRSSIASPEFRPNPEAMLAIDLLSAACADPAWDAGAAAAARDGSQREFLLARLAAPVAARAERESTAIGTALAARPAAAGGPVAWGEASIPAPGSLELAYRGPEEVAAGSTADLRFAIANRGSAAAGRLYGVVKADLRSPLWEDEVAVGSVAAGETAERALRFRVPPRLFPGEERFTLELFADGIREPLAAVPVRLRIAAAPRPHFSYAWRVEDPGILRPGEPAMVRIEVVNDGDGASGPVVARVFKANDLYLQLGETRFRFPAGIPAGERVALRVPTTIRERVNQAPFSAREVRLQVNVQEDFAAGPEGDGDGDGGDEGEDVDNRYRSALFTTIAIPVGEATREHEVHQPLITLASASANGLQGRLAVRIADDDPRFLALLLNEEKIDMRPLLADDLRGGIMAYEKRFALRPGVNNLRLEVADHDQVTAVLPLRLWGDEAAAAAPAAAAAAAAPAATAPATAAMVP